MISKNALYVNIFLIYTTNLVKLNKIGAKFLYSLLSIPVTRLRYLKIS